MEEVFLNKLMTKKLPVTVFLTCNVKLQGVILAADEKGIFLEHEGRLQFIYKHAISTLSAGSALTGDEVVG